MAADSPPASGADPNRDWPRSAQKAAAVLFAATALGLAGFAFRPGRPLPPDAPPVVLDLNRASRADLLLLPGIGEQMAQRIEDHRNRNGPFASLDELRKIPGLGPATLDRLRPWLTVGPPHAAAAEKEAPTLVVPPADAPAKTRIPSEPIDLNTASIDELRRLPGIGPKLSQRIVETRSRKPFAAVDDLRRVPGIGPKTLEKVRPFATVAQVAEP